MASHRCALPEPCHLVPLQAVQAAAGSDSTTPVDEAAQQLLLSREQVKRLQAELMLPLQQVRFASQLPVH